MAKKRKWYVVWVGINPGIYDNWADCKAQITGFKNARYKAFETVKEAQEAFRGSATSYLSKEDQNIVTSKRVFPASIDPNSLSVDAACSGNPGLMEYRGVRTGDAMQLFHKGPFEQGTNNVGEFLALVHGLAYLKQIGKENIIIYTDSKTAMAWVRNKKVKTTLKKSAKNKVLFELMERGLRWLQSNSIKTRIVKWDTKSLGEIPADFGRK